jgi:hypothetical protein
MLDGLSPQMIKLLEAKEPDRGVKLDKLLICDLSL